MNDNTAITVRDLALRDEHGVVMKDVSFTVRRGDTFAIMGGTGSGKSTLLAAMIGLVEPAAGEVCYGDQSFTRADPDRRHALSRRFGVVFQSGALWRELTLRENVALPLKQLTKLGSRAIQELVELKLAVVGLTDVADCYPDQIGASMQRRAGLARAMALDPEILFFDEPTAGLDPVSARGLDDLVLELHASLGTTIVIVSHDLASIFAIASNGIYVDHELKTVTAQGDPKEMLMHAPSSQVHAFLTRAATKGVT